MSTYSKRQNKKSLGIENLQGVSVVNVPAGKKFNVKFRAEVRRDGRLINGGTADTSLEAAQLANRLFTEVYGSKRLAQKAGYWN